jgi:dTDP-4-amino-4,6-dideoxygalactose transaminase
MSTRSEDRGQLQPQVIYDAAHAFGVRNERQHPEARRPVDSQPARHQVFNTFEGGAIICPDAKTKQRIDHLKNFGFVDEVTVVAAGINGKMSEINAAFGLLQLQHIDEALERRKAIDARYRELLRNIPAFVARRMPAKPQPTTRTSPFTSKLTTRSAGMPCLTSSASKVSSPGATSIR